MLNVMPVTDSAGVPAVCPESNSSAQAARPPGPSHASCRPAAPRGQDHRRRIRIAPRVPRGQPAGVKLLPALLAALAIASGLGGTAALAATPPADRPWLADTKATLQTELCQRFGESQRPRLERGLKQVGEFWRARDGDAAAFATFVRQNFAGDPATLDALFDRFQRRLEVLDGLFAEMGYEFRLHTDLDRGTVLPFDETFSAYNPAAHVADDLFQNQLAFVVLLNFPLTTLDQRLTDGAHWSRRQWAEARLAQRFARRVPADVQQAISDAQSAAELYINEYKIWTHHLVDDQGRRLFPAGQKLITHWNLRDEIKAQYSNATNGLAAQRQLQRVMERIIDQSIPAVVINNPRVDWNPVANAVKPAAVNDAAAPPPPPAATNHAAEPDTRYAMLLAVFRANRLADAFSPAAPTFIARRFEEDRQMSEARVQAMLEQVLASPQFAAVGKLVAQRLGRPLEPFDIWYDGFRPRERYSEAELDARTRKRFPTPAAYHQQMTNILVQLGFTPERAAYLQANIEVEASRGTGHAMGGAMRGQKARLRTRVEADGMNYKGFNIALHELGHNLEETFSLNQVDHTLLAGVPNNAFTEALAMVIQNHDFEVLGLAAPDARSRAWATLSDFWNTTEIAGVALVDMAVWHWLYAHPEATPAQLKAATLEIARGIWNRFYAPVFGARDGTLLAVYSHMIRDVLYLPDYPIGHLIAFQLDRQFRKSAALGPEFERITRFGNVTPDLWMQNATGSPVSADPLLEATQEALAGQPGR